MSQFSYPAAVQLHAGMSPQQAADLVSEAQKQHAQGLVISINTGQEQAEPVLAAAAAAITRYNEVELYVLGYGVGFECRLLAPFHPVRHLNLNFGGLTEIEFLADFDALRTLTIQLQSGRPLSLASLSGMRNLERLTVPAAVRDAGSLLECTQLRSLRCSSGMPVLDGIAGHLALRYLEISFGTNRDLSALASLPSLRGLELYLVKGLDGDDLLPLGDCASLTALSLGALRNVAHLTALQGTPSHTLRALLLEQVPNLPDLRDIATCRELDQLGLWESRPQDKRLNPLAALPHLHHLTLGDVYPKVEIDGLLEWYTGSIAYRNKINRGQGNPRWRSSVEKLDTQHGPHL